MALFRKGAPIGRRMLIKKLNHYSNNNIHKINGNLFGMLIII